MTPPPTSDDGFPHRGKKFSTLWKKSARFFRAAGQVLPHPPDALAWGRLLRLPNLLTVPGDILAGFLLAGSADAWDWAQLLLAIPAGLLLYAAGLVLYEMLTGTLPFKGEYDQAMLYAVINEEPESISKVRTDIPDDLRRIVRRALAKVREMDRVLAPASRRAA